MLRHFKKLLRDKNGSTLVEFSLIVAPLLLITFGIAEGGYVLYQQNTAQKATQIGARYISTRSPIVPGISDCGVTPGSTVLAGTDCNSVPGSTTWSFTCQNGGGAGCDTAVMANVLTEMQKVFPGIEASNLKVVISGTGYGYVGRGKPVPAITVSLINLSYDYVAVTPLISALQSIAGENVTNPILTANISTAQTTIVSEDYGEGAG